MIYGYETILDLKGCVISKKAIKDYVVELCQEIKMKRYGKCHIVYFGNGRFKGYSVFQFITTSSIVGHFTKTEAYINVFSCKDYNPKIVKDVTKKYFKPSILNSRFIARS